VVSCKSLYGFDQHSIYPELDTFVMLIEGKELDVLLNDDGGPGVVDAVSPILFGKPCLLLIKEELPTASSNFGSKIFL